MAVWPYDDPDFVRLYDSRYLTGPVNLAHTEFEVGTVETLLRSRPGDRRWLDVFCGTGFHLRRARGAASRTGVDRSARMLEMAEARDGFAATFVERDARDLAATSPRPRRDRACGSGDRILVRLHPSGHPLRRRWGPAGHGGGHRTRWRSPARCLRPGRTFPPDPPGRRRRLRPAGEDRCGDVELHRTRGMGPRRHDRPPSPPHRGHARPDVRAAAVARLSPFPGRAGLAPPRTAATGAERRALRAATLTALPCPETGRRGPSGFHHGPSKRPAAARGQTALSWIVSEIRFSKTAWCIASAMTCFISSRLAIVS